MKAELYRQLELWNEKEAYQQIIDMLEAYPLHDYETVSHLARAYNNRGEDGDFEKAIELLRMVEDLGKEDPLWHYRMGYACFFSGRYTDAQLAFEETLELDPDDEDAIAFLDMCTEKILTDLGGFPEQFISEFYSEEEMDLLENCINTCFGECESVYHEIVSPDIHVDICLIPPNEERDFYTLVTMGMGAHRMDIPEELQDFNLERAELLICLPSDWNLNSDDERWYWPVRMLKVLARIPVQENTWLGWGHTVDYGEPFDETTDFSAAMLISPANFGKGEFVCPFPDGTEVNFYQIIPLYREEMEYKIEHGADELLEHLDESALVIDPQRAVFSGGKKLS